MDWKAPSEETTQYRKRIVQTLISKLRAAFPSHSQIPEIAAKLELRVFKQATTKEQYLQDIAKHIIDISKQQKRTQLGQPSATGQQQAQDASSTAGSAASGPGDGLHPIHSSGVPPTAMQQSRFLSNQSAGTSMYGARPAGQMYGGQGQTQSAAQSQGSLQSAVSQGQNDASSYWRRLAELKAKYDGKLKEVMTVFEKYTKNCTTERKRDFELYLQRMKVVLTLLHGTQATQQFQPRMQILDAAEKQINDWIKKAQTLESMTSAADTSSSSVAPSGPPSTTFPYGSQPGLLRTTSLRSNSMGESLSSSRDGLSFQLPSSGGSQQQQQQQQQNHMQYQMQYRSSSGQLSTGSQMNPQQLRRQQQQQQQQLMQQQLMMMQKQQSATASGSQAGTAAASLQMQQIMARNQALQVQGASQLPQSQQMLLLRKQQQLSIKQQQQRAQLLQQQQARRELKSSGGARGQPASNFQHVQQQQQLQQKHLLQQQALQQGAKAEPAAVAAAAPAAPKQAPRVQKSLKRFLDKISSDETTKLAPDINRIVNKLRYGPHLKTAIVAEQLQEPSGGQGTGSGQGATGATREDSGRASGENISCFWWDHTLGKRLRDEEREQDSASPLVVWSRDTSVPAEPPTKQGKLSSLSLGVDTFSAAECEDVHRKEILDLIAHDRHLSTTAGNLDSVVPVVVDGDTLFEVVFNGEDVESRVLPVDPSLSYFPGVGEYRVETERLLSCTNSKGASESLLYASLRSKRKEMLKLEVSEAAQYFTLKKECAIDAVEASCLVFSSLCGAVDAVHCLVPAAYPLVSAQLAFPNSWSSADGCAAIEKAVRKEVAASSGRHTVTHLLSILRACLDG